MILRAFAEIPERNPIENSRPYRERSDRKGEIPTGHKSTLVTNPFQLTSSNTSNKLTFEFQCFLTPINPNMRITTGFSMTKYGKINSRCFIRLLNHSQSAPDQLFLNPNYSKLFRKKFRDFSRPCRTTPCSK